MNTDSNGENTPAPQGASPEAQAPEEQIQLLLKTRLQTAEAEFKTAMETHGRRVDVMGAVMNRWIDALLPLPDEAACDPGCDYCCHMGQEVSIPEALIVFHELKAAATPEGLAFFRDRVLALDKSGETGRESWWREAQAPCPFLNREGDKTCLIYGIRPFSCRAHHSLDKTVCQKGFEQRQEVDIPCFPLFRQFTSLYSMAFMKGTEGLGLAAHGVGFVKALALLFERDDATEQWLAGEDVFRDCQFH